MSSFCGLCMTKIWSDSKMFSNKGEKNGLAKNLE